MTLEEAKKTIELSNNSLKLVCDNTTDVDIDNNEVSNDLLLYHYGVIKEFIYNTDDDEIIYKDKQDIQEELTKQQLETYNKLHILQLEISTVENLDLVIYDSATNELLVRYDKIPKEQYKYITSVDRLIQLCSNYKYNTQGDLEKIVGKSIKRMLGNREVEDEEKGDFYIDVEFPKLGGSNKSDIDYSKVVVSAALDGVDLFKIFKILYPETLFNKNFGLKYELKILRTTIDAWSEEE